MILTFSIGRVVGKFLHLLPPMYFVLATLYLCLCHCWSGTNNAEVLRPRGVSLSLKSFYEPTKNFSCLDGSGTFPFYFVNDDYCDCEDGSDEPGTSACANGKFHCLNYGYVSEDIPSSRVNDDICDCCDGSDEYNSNAECANLCIELGRLAKEAAQKEQELYQRGYQLWQEYTVKGKQIRENNKVKLQSLKISEEDAEKIKTAKEAIKNEAEDKEKAALAKYEAIKEDAKREAEELEMQKHQEEEGHRAQAAFKELDLNQDGMLTFNEIQQFSKFDSNHDGSVSEEEAKFFLHMKDSMYLEEFISTGWMIMKPIFLMDKIPTQVPPMDALDEQQGAAAETDDVDDSVYDKEEDLSEDLLDDDELEQPPQFPPVEDKEPTPESKPAETIYDEETQRLVDAASDARREFQDAVGKLESTQNDIKQIQADLEADFGPEEQFAVLKGQCFDYDDREYTYKLCPFERASQVPKSGGTDVSLGQWGHWAGPDDNKYTRMKFENGQGCWNGPARSAMVLLKCGVDNKVLSASEPNRCEYSFEFETPALCSTLPEARNVHEHTEL